MDPERDADPGVLVEVPFPIKAVPAGRVHQGLGGGRGGQILFRHPEVPAERRKGVGVQGQHRLDLGRVPHHHDVPAPVDGADGRLGQGLSRLVDEQVSQGLRPQMPAHAGKACKR